MCSNAYNMKNKVEPHIVLVTAGCRALSCYTMSIWLAWYSCPLTAAFRIYKRTARSRQRTSQRRNTLQLRQQIIVWKRSVIFTCGREAKLRNRSAATLVYVNEIHSTLILFLMSKHCGCLIGIISYGCSKTFFSCWYHVRNLHCCLHTSNAAVQQGQQNKAVLTCI